MEKETIQYIEGKHETFRDMFNIIKGIHTMLDNDVLIIDSQELNKEFFKKILDKAEDYLPS